MSLSRIGSKGVFPEQGIDHFTQEIVRPSQVSRWVSKQGWLPFRRQVAHFIEDAKLTAIAPIVLARGLRSQFKDNIVAGVPFLPPVAVGLFVSIVPPILNPGFSPDAGAGILAATLSYMTQGYLLYHQSSGKIAPYRQELNQSPSK